MNNFESISKIIPFGGILILFFSSSNLVIYYNVFNISINDYLSLTEYPTLFIDDILYYILIFGAGVISYFISPYSEYNLDYSKIKDYSIFKIVRRIILIITIILIIIFGFIIYETEILSKKLQFVEMGGFFVLLLFYNYAAYTKIKFNYLVFIFSALLLYCPLDGYIDAQKILENDIKRSYEITIGSKKIKTNDNFKYIGKSEKYVFFYDLKKEKSTILPLENLKKIEVKKR